MRGRRLGGLFLPLSTTIRHSGEGRNRFCGLGLAKSFRPPPEGESLLFCLSKREVTQRKRHPAWRLPPIHGRQVRELRPGFSTAHPCAGEKESASCRFSLRGLSTTAHRRTGAPGRAAGHPGPHSMHPPCGRWRINGLRSFCVRLSRPLAFSNWSEFGNARCTNASRMHYFAPRPPKRLRGCLCVFFNEPRLCGAPLFGFGTSCDLQLVPYA
jgi:hypothetical protein